MMEKQRKGLVVGDVVIQTGDDFPIQTGPPTPSVLKFAPLASSEKRKTVSKKIDTGRLLDAVHNSYHGS